MSKGYFIEIDGEDYHIDIMVTDVNVYNVEIVGKYINEKYSIMKCYRDVYRVGKLVKCGKNTPTTIEYDNSDGTFKMLYPNNEIFIQIIKILKVTQSLNYKTEIVATDKTNPMWGYD